VCVCACTRACACVWVGRLVVCMCVCVQCVLPCSDRLLDHILQVIWSKRCPI